MPQISISAFKVIFTLKQGYMEHNSPMLGFSKKILTGYSTLGTSGKEVKCNILPDEGWIQRLHPTMFNTNKLKHL